MIWKWYHTRWARLHRTAWVKETYLPFKGWVRQ